MKTLIIGENNFTSIENIYKKNFLKLKCTEVKIYSYWRPKKFFLIKLLNFLEKFFYYLFCFIQNFIMNRRIKKDNKVYDLIIVFNGYHMNKRTIQNLKKKTKKSLINIQTDNIFIKKNILHKNLKLFDKIYIWSKKIQVKLIKSYLIKKKNIFYLPFGYDQNYFKVINSKKINNLILFYGSWDKEREKKIKEINNKIIKIYGNGWEKADKSFKETYDIGNELAGKNLAEQISKSLICLNLFRNQAKNYINMRSFEVIGYGGGLLSEKSKEQSIFFKNFKGIKYFKDIKDINAIYKKILKTKKKLLKERKQNYIKIKKHDYFNRAKYILENEKKHFISR